MLRTLWYSTRVRNWLFQIALLGGLAALVAWIVGNTLTNLAARGIRTGFEFLSRPARFPISESVLAYDSADTYGWAFVVGIGNTVFVSALTILLASLLGFAVALARGMGNPLLSALAGAYVTLMRNMPLIVQLLFWYALATTAFPPARQALNPLPGVYLSQRGIHLPALAFEGTAVLVLVALAAGVAAALGRRRFLGRGGLLWPLGAALAAGLLLILLRGSAPELDMPLLVGLNFRGGLHLTPEFAALMIGLVLYTAAFISEIIRGGIEAIARGQWEAGRALGLTRRQILRHIIVPQALRIIIPPLTSQYLSTVKNTTLALAVGYPELGLVVGTVINQSGQAIESILIVLAVFLSISVSVSLFMNWYNARVALVVR